MIRKGDVTYMTLGGSYESFNESNETHNPWKFLDNFPQFDEIGSDGTCGNHEPVENTESTAEAEGESPNETDGPERIEVTRSIDETHEAFDILHKQIDDALNPDQHTEDDEPSEEAAPERIQVTRPIDETIREFEELSKQIEKTLGPNKPTEEGENQD